MPSCSIARMAVQHMPDQGRCTGGTCPKFRQLPAGRPSSRLAADGNRRAPPWLPDVESDREWAAVATAELLPGCAGRPESELNSNKKLTFKNQRFDDGQTLQLASKTSRYKKTPQTDGSKVPIRILHNFC